MRPTVASLLRADADPDLVVRAIGVRETRALSLARRDPAVLSAFSLLVEMFRAPSRLGRRLGFDARSASSFVLAAAAVELLDDPSVAPTAVGESARLAVLEVLMGGGLHRLEDGLGRLAARLSERVVGAHLARVLAREPELVPSLRAELAIRARIEARARARVEHATAALDARGTVPRIVARTLGAIVLGLAEPT